MKSERSDGITQGKGQKEGAKVRNKLKGLEEVVQRELQGLFKPRTTWDRDCLHGCSACSPGSQMSNKLIEV